MKIDIPDHPDIAEALRTGYPRRFQHAPEIVCPVCDEEAEIIYRDIHNQTVGCNNCIAIYDADEIEQERAYGD